MPSDPDDRSRLFEGVDRASFESLGGRLIPCRLGCGRPIAVDLLWRVWWWNNETQDWGIVPFDDDAALAKEHVRQWLRVAPLALDAWRKMRTDDSYPETHLKTFSDIQETLLHSWGLPPLWPVWREAFLYRTLTLDGRWLLLNHEVPVFDAHVFQVLVLAMWGGALTPAVREQLLQDPVTAPMIGMFDAATVAAEPPPRLRVIPGGLRDPNG